MTKSNEQGMPSNQIDIDNIINESNKDDTSETNNKKLNQYYSTSISGCNITSSALYVVALTAKEAGKYTPFVLIFIGFLLYLFRFIYSEVVFALPVNGGTYNLLRVVAGPKSASFAGMLTMLSYVTTAVISSVSGAVYLKHTLENPDWFDTTVVTIIILTFCCILNIIGITESAKVSLGIFAFHLITMITLVVCSIVTAMTSIPHVGERTVLDDNWNDTSLPHSLPLSLFYGLGAGLLGVSGFESSANFRESQADGVFPKTLRNMWAIVATLNPTLGMLAICLLPLSTISEEASSGALLSTMAGAVLSAFVGFGGLCVRMSFDGDLPRFLQLQTSWNTNYCIILSYFVLTITMVFVCDGDISDLSGVYTIAFLSVMSCFAIGNMLLKYFPSTGLPKAPPEQQASWIGVSFGLCGVLLGLVSNIMSRSVTALVAFVGFSMFFSLVIVVTRIFQKPHKRRSSNIESSMKNALLSDFATITEENFVRAYV